MDNMYVDVLERFIIDRTHCSLEDLKKLKQVYSYLAEDLLDEEILEGNINGILKKVYKKVSTTIAGYIESYNVDDIVEMPDKEGYKFVNYKLSEQSIKDISKVAEQLKNCEPTIAVLCDETSKFNNYIDKIVDFDETLETNGYWLLEWLIDNDIVNYGEILEGEQV